MVRFKPFKSRGINQVGYDEKCTHHIDTWYRSLSPPLLFTHHNHISLGSVPCDAPPSEQLASCYHLSPNVYSLQGCSLPPYTPVFLHQGLLVIEMRRWYVVCVLCTGLHLKCRSLPMLEKLVQLTNTCRFLWQNQSYRLIPKDEITLYDIIRPTLDLGFGLLQSPL